MSFGVPVRNGMVWAKASTTLSTRAEVAPVLHNVDLLIIAGGGSGGSNINGGAAAAALVGILLFRRNRSRRVM